MYATTAEQRHAAKARELGATPSGLPTPDEPLWRQRRLAVEDEDAAGRLDRIDEMKRLRQRPTLSLLALGYSYSEIAERLGLSEKQVEHRLSAGRATLRVCYPGPAGGS